MEGSKKRCLNYTRYEIEVLVWLVDDHKEVVECKKTDTISNSAKEVRWEELAVQFNSKCGTGRTGKMLRSKWDSLKKTTKRDYGELKQRYYRTGGGGYVPKKLDVITEKVLEIIGIGATGRLSRFDSDSAASDDKTPTTPKLVVVSDISVGSSQENETDLHLMPSCSSWRTWSPQQLRQPLSKPLVHTMESHTPKFAEMGSSPTADKEGSVIAPSNDSILNDTPVGYDIEPFIIDEPEARACLEDERNEEEEPNNPATHNTPITNPGKRRRLLRLESTATKLQKKRSGNSYESLLQKKIEFFEYQMSLLKEETEHKRRLREEKHALEMKVLKEEAEHSKILRDGKHVLEMKLLEADLRKKDLEYNLLAASAKK